MRDYRSLALQLFDQYTEYFATDYWRYRQGISEDPASKKPPKEDVQQQGFPGGHPPEY